MCGLGRNRPPRLDMPPPPRPSPVKGEGGTKSRSRRMAQLLQTACSKDGAHLLANEGAFLRYHGDVEQLARQNLAEEPTVMSLRRRVSAVYGIIILGGLLALALAAGLNTPLPFFGWLLAPWRGNDARKMPDMREVSLQCRTPTRDGLFRWVLAAEARAQV